MGNIRAIIFDAGGTLIYPARPVGETYARLARAHGVELAAAETNIAFRQAMKSASPRIKGTIPSNGDDRAWWKQVVTRSIPEGSFPDPEDFEVFFEEAYVHYADPAAWNVYPEVPSVLQTLSAYPVDLFVLSNWDARLHSVLDGNGLSKFLPKRFISAELGWEKPDPKIYGHVAHVVGIPTSSLLSVGDDLVNDVEAPKAAGWRAVRINRPENDLWAAIEILKSDKKL